jgi:hypothetical protein
MTYVRVHPEGRLRNLNGADVSHLAELVRGNCTGTSAKAPSSAPSGHLLPKGRRAAVRG